ncbi:MAG: GNAT family N-acetyltransferase [Lentisphaerae bacterium]|jgi:GNAT superfamily N-acetyltransferase|nr:GNAT family N-acetyltransferase [Lentisphaerota bacterium]MBT4821068.1 GNAT family N-acetyltransferase [Lentisphaerota bacterium]MBT5605393.1 GNAT family N-acetyltransferase [Lentisphaerota bacterium]MBT7062017.1 GNAT family N-acetyltransferase [Lentisphaerota bacterium]MBT7848613.1 GNAT family N-acetyltransferase [Lentisphaerota bacterium]
MSNVLVRQMIPDDRDDVADLICLSTNYWYQSHGHPIIFSGGPETTTLHFDIYHTLPGSGGYVAVDAGTNRVVGSCFRHDRPTHVSLGIMNVHPNHFGRGVARTLLDTIVAYGEERGKPVRLVSSAMNLDSFSLYTRAGFVPHCAYQDMFIGVPENGMEATHPFSGRVREATMDDLEAIVALERDVSHIERPGDHRHFIDNPDGIWHVCVCDGESSALNGVLISCQHTGCNMIGPGVARDADSAAALLLAQLNHNRGRTPVFLLPVAEPALVQQAYDWGGRNCETHFCQVRGEFPGFDGISMPTFMPETG